MNDDFRGGGLIELEEWRPRLVQLRNAQASALTRVAAGHLDVEVTDQPEVFRLRASSHVGALSVLDLRIAINPKVGIRNLLFLLDIELGSDIWRPETALYAKDAELLAAMASFFARTLQGTLAQGLLRTYRDERERLPALRGRLDFVEMTRRPGLPIPIPSMFSEHTADVFANRILKQATRILLRLPGVPSEATRRLYRCLIALEEVSDSFEDLSQMDRFVFDRLTERYGPAMRLATLIIRHTSIRTTVGGTESTAFMINMNDLYQTFLLHRLRRALAGRLEVDGEPPTPLDLAGDLVMNPDYLLRLDGHPVYVADAKYKIVTSSGLAGSSDHYQMLAYCTALDLPEGVLIYCTVEGSKDPVDVVVRTSGHRIMTYPLPLNGSRAELERRISELADWIAWRSGQSDEPPTRSLVGADP